MKNLSLIINGVLVVAVAVLFYLHFSGPKADAPVSLASDTTIVNAKGKAIVYVDIDTLLKNYEYSKIMQAELQTKKTTMDNTLKNIQAAFDKKLKDYQTKGPYLTPAEQQQTENDLKTMQMNGEKSAYDMQNNLAAEQSKFNEALFLKVESFLKDYAKANGHIYILQHSSALSPILYGDPQLNITVDVVNKLNELYKKEKEAEVK